MAARKKTGTQRQKLFLKSIELNDYRSCLHTRAELQAGLSVLIGPNGSGKTNFLRGISLLSSIVGQNYRTRYEEDPFASESFCRATFQLGDDDVELQSITALSSDDKNADRVMKATNDWLSDKFLPNQPPLQTAPLDELINLREVHLPRRGSHVREILEHLLPRTFIKAYTQIEDFSRKIEYFSASQFTNSHNSPIYFEYTEQSGRPYIYDPGPKTKFLFDLYRLKQEETDTYEDYFDIVGPNGMGLISGVEFEKVETSSIDVRIRTGGRSQEVARKKNIVIPIFYIHGNKLSANQLSEGTFKSLALIYYLMNAKGSVLLIEEPEVCVHRGLLCSITELILLCSADRQIIISTHSDDVLDQVPLESVYSVRLDEEDGTIVEKLDDSLGQNGRLALKNYLATEGTLGEYWKHVGFD